MFSIKMLNKLWISTISRSCSSKSEIVESWRKMLFQVKEVTCLNINRHIWMSMMLPKMIIEDKLRRGHLNNLLTKRMTFTDHIVKQKNHLLLIKNLRESFKSFTEKQKRLLLRFQILRSILKRNQEDSIPTMMASIILIKKLFKRKEKKKWELKKRSTRQHIEENWLLEYLEESYLQGNMESSWTCKI